MNKMTKKQQNFIANKIAGMTNRDAAIAAGYAVGSARVAADKLMKVPAVRSAIQAGTGSAGKEPAANWMKPAYGSSLELMRDTYNNPKAPMGVRFDAAKQALPYEHARVGEVGKKQAKQARAEAAAGKRGPGRPPKFAPSKPPQLRVV